MRDDLEVLRGERVALVSAITGRASGRARALAEDYVRRQTQRLVRERLRLSPSATHSISSASPQLAPLDDVLGELVRVFTDLRDLGRDFADLHDAAPDGLSSESLAALRPAIIGVLDAHDTLVTGAGVVVAPDLLEDEPLWLEWWWRTDRGPVEALRVNLDPAAPDFHDYRSSEYFLSAQSSPTPSVTAPTVDYACTNEYAITVSSPVRSQGRLLGVAGADVLVESVERLVVPALNDLDRPAALVSSNGRVIASNVGHVLPGERLDIPPGAQPATSSSLVVAARGRRLRRDGSRSAFGVVTTSPHSLVKTKSSY